MITPTPPKFARWILLRFLRGDLTEEVEGDLEEKFYVTATKRSVFRARINYWYQVLHYMRPFALRKNKFTLFYYDMFQNYFKISWRSLLKQRMYSVIKIGGLALGIAACFLITLYINDELNYDKHYTHTNRIYRLVAAVELEDSKHGRFIDWPAPAATVLEQDYPEVEKAGRYLSSSLFGAGENEIRRSDRVENSHEEGFVYFDQKLIELLDLPVIAGNLHHALDEPNTIVITRRKAEKYFSGEDAVGKTFVINNNDKRLFKIGAVIEDFPLNSHLQFDFLMTLTGVEFWGGEQTYWMASNYSTYVLLKPDADVKDVERKITKGIIEKYYIPAMVATGQVGGMELLKKARLQLQPIDQIHIDGSVADGLQHGDMRFIWLFGAIAVFILIIACINFINLSTARSANRAKEVGLRKTVGSMRSHLVNQFLTESFLFSLLALIAGVILSWLLLPYFNLLAAKTLTFPWQAWWLIPGIIVVAIVIGLMAGLYPAFYLSAFKPANVLKGNVSKGSKNSSTRSMLVVFQFTTSIVLIISTVVIYRQMNFILNKKLGFDREQVLLLQGTTTLGDKAPAFKSELLKLSRVANASLSDYLPIRGGKRDGNTFYNLGMDKIEKGVSAQKWVVDADYIKTLGIKLVEGRDFNADMISDSTSIIINQTMAKQLNLTDPIGKQIQNWQKYTVIGVVEDFHFESMKENIRPLCLAAGQSPSMILVKVNGSEMREAIIEISTLWNQFSPNQPVRFNFLNDRYAATYSDVERMGRIFTTFAVLAIIVACLGLFALSAFMVEQRSKEISIRIVLGASMNSIFQLLTKNFVALVAVSFVLAAPIAWYIMQQWLQDFVYRTDITWDVFIVSGVSALTVAVLTVSYQAIKAALDNPVQNLKSD